MKEKATWTVVALYEDAQAREAAVAFCDSLVERFWAKFGFDVSWWSFALLEQPASAKAAADKAAEAQLVIVASQPEGEMPLHLRAWVESWVPRRGEREGALVGLLDWGQQAAWASEKSPYLRALARRAGMDYLTEVPHDLARSFPDSLEPYTERARQVTGILEEILHQHTAPPRL